MKKLIVSVALILTGLGSLLQAQKTTNFISCNVDGKEWQADAKRMKIPVSGFEYLAIAAFQVNPDVQVWLRFYYFSDSLKPGTYSIISENDMESDAKIKANRDRVWVLVDYTSETKGLGYAFHDGESLSGTLTISEVSKTSIKGSFEAKMNGVYYNKRAVAAVTGSGIRSNIERKVLTSAGGGMLANGGPHDHANTKKSDDTDSIVLSNGQFHLDWSKTEKTSNK